MEWRPECDPAVVLQGFINVPYVCSQVSLEIARTCCAAQFDRCQSSAGAKTRPSGLSETDTSTSR
ncbi:hypothetical protein SAMN04488132_103333 [Sediminibacterium ginsengisoli]|uniref:Uncharacterized protein n=1 Tax=Sediminibacterium ginsengisoli TaxID=413434 RepID=A0A1T4MDZ8_9BACT|nr:hypothetical protein SAMN04488132_103333 [Sediminibacterium ginsengisoli]